MRSSGLFQRREALVTDSFLGILYLAVLLVAAVVDIRQRRFPHVLFILLLVLSVAIAFRSYGLHRLLVNLVVAVLCCALLVMFELVWRRVRGGMGMGAGDIKALLCLMIVHPMLAVGSFGVGLMLLAVCGVMLRRGSLPALPFLFSAYILLPVLFSF